MKNSPLASHLVQHVALATLAVCGFLSTAVAADLGVVKIGLGTAPITPTLDAGLAGYYFHRSADGVHDHLWAKAMVVDDGREQVAIVTLDLLNVLDGFVEQARDKIQLELGIPPDHVMISATHTHTAPDLTSSYAAELVPRIVECVQTAVATKQPVHLYVTAEQEASLPHNRRYLMKNGKVVTNPGFLNPDIVRPVGPIDPRVVVLYAEQTDRQPLLTWVNYTLHPDTVGGTWISADYPFYLGKLLARVKGPDMLTIFAQGALGDINHWDVSRPGPQRGQEEARRIGEVLGSAVIKAYTHLEKITNCTVRVARTISEMPTQKYTAAQLAEARKLVAKPARTDVDFELSRVEAERIVNVEDHFGPNKKVEIQVLTIGPVAFVGIPGEYFSELGMMIQKQSPFPYTAIIGLANDYNAYIPTRRAYEEGGYEPTSAILAPGAGENMAEQALTLLRKLKD